MSQDELERKALEVSVLFGDERCEAPRRASRFYGMLREAYGPGTTCKVEIRAGRDLKPRDTMRVWWRGGLDTIVRFREYSGPHGPGRIAVFATMTMTIYDNDIYEVMLEGEVSK